MKSFTNKSRYPVRLQLESLEDRLCLTTYTTVDLAPLPDHNTSTASGLNDNGLVVGRSSDRSNTLPSSAVVWQIDENGNAAVSALPGLPGSRSSRAMEVNNQGIIAGEDLAGAVVWTGSFGDYTPHGLGTPGGSFVYSDARSISDADPNGNFWVVGNAETNHNNGSFVRHGVLWQIDSLGTVLSTTDLEPQGTNVWANDVEVVDGSIQIAGSDGTRAIVWVTNLQGIVQSRTDLGTLGGSVARAWAINGHGDAAGDSESADSYIRDAFLYQNGTMTELGPIGNKGSRAYALNVSGVVVGDYEYRTPPTSNIVGSFDAFVWENGTMYDLQERLSDKNFWRLFGAYDVNAKGEIVGSGSFGNKRDNAPHGFLALPVTDEGGGGGGGGGKGGGKGSGPKKLVADSKGTNLGAGEDSTAEWEQSLFALAMNEKLRH